MFAKSTLVVDRFEIAVPVQFCALEGVRILHISDLHLRAASKRFNAFFERLGKEVYDIIVCSGDMVDHDNGITACIEYLSELRSRQGTFVTFGNHDKFRLGLKEFFFFSHKERFTPNDLPRLRQGLEACGMRVLVNEVAHVKINGVAVAFVGLDCPLGFDRVRNPSELFKAEVRKMQTVVDQGKEDEYSILISHVPDLIDMVNLPAVRLILASHTHGGQVRLPFIGPLVALSSFQRQYNMGVYRYRHAYLHVSSGVGETLTTPIRIGCPARASVLTLRGVSVCA